MRHEQNIGVGCQTIRAELDALARSPAVALPAWAAEHLARCRSCAREVAAARLARGLVAQPEGEPQVPAGFAGGVMAAIARDSRRDEGVAELWAPARKLLPAFAAAAACCLILLRVMGGFEPPEYLSGEELSPGEQFVLGVTPTDPDAVLTVVMAGEAR